MSDAGRNVSALIDLSGRVAIVTGAGHGIGAATARALASAGAAVVLAGRRSQPIEQVARDIVASGGAALSVPCDVSVADEVAALVARAETEHGRVDILVNNAGVIGDGRLDTMTASDWDTILGVNLRGAWLCARAVFQGMLARQAGTIVNIASISGQTGGLSANAPYAASKGGLIALTKATARQMAPWGRANAVAPGQIETSMGARNAAQVAAVASMAPLGRLGTPEEVAACVIFLASPMSSYITGSVLNVNGGLLME